MRAAIAYALDGNCDAAIRVSRGVDALAEYSAVASGGVRRFVVDHGRVESDLLNRNQLCSWVDGRDPFTGVRRGRELGSQDADLLLDGTINAPKSFSVAALLHPELADEFEALQDRLRNRIMETWQRELNARRGAGGRVREALQRVEVVELQHRRSRALDPHVHRHLWLNVKVLGEDGQWSNVDSRVAMKMHTLINAEGELASRTDPRWIAALERYGYTLDSAGEIAEIAQAVRPLSRRSNQIEANRAVMLAEWRDAHPGQEPDRDIQRQIDRLAWAKDRPRKPRDLDEADWEELIRDEISGIDPLLIEPRSPVHSLSVPLSQLDLDLLAAKAIVEADGRSASCGGRFGAFDLRAGALRAVAGSGVVAERERLQETIDEIVRRALTHTVDLLDEDGPRPDHIKGYMAAATASLKVDLAARFDRLNVAGAVLSEDAMQLVAQSVLNTEVDLHSGQAQAAGAIAGTDRLVTITGPAGTGKTTMLRVAKHALLLQGRRTIVVAPTKKAASVASREIGTAASSLHALLADHGWRWSRDAAGAETWSRLEPGAVDPQTGTTYDGPRRYPIAPDDRIVVDEAGMVDLHTANALATLAEETGAGIAMVGDHLQAMPVGHSGAMACMTRRSGRIVELTAVHRFTDPGYAELTLRLREPGSQSAALEVAGALAARGLIRRVNDAGDARDFMVGSYFHFAGMHKRVALVTSTNDEADLINEAIQQGRLELGQLGLHRIAVGKREQRILEGDIVQTRRNDRKADVENRAVWVVRRIRPDAVELSAISDSADTRLVSAEYVAEHVHLAYASTVHGIQGETMDASVVGPGVDASGLYVGMTRGRSHNEALAIARSDDEAVSAVADCMMRGLPEVTIDDSRRAARVELGRAAREAQPAEHTIARWNDLRARPLGATINIESLRDASHARLAVARDRAIELNSWIASASRVLGKFAVLTTSMDSIDHARRKVVSAPAADEVNAYALQSRVDGRAAELREVLLMASEEQAFLERVDAEIALRATLGSAQLERERAEREAAELQSVATAGTPGGPTWAR
ncbi:MobF family relaxase [Microbacterium pumilum]|uniref:MobF family relaxase n=1 Tax=Microbacterium pumilum TaxID=344165 RepID=UPI0031E37E89